MVLTQHSLFQENELQTETSPFDVFKVRPLLKLKLSWSQEPTNGLVNRPKLYQQTSETNGVKKDAASKDRPSSNILKTTTDATKNGENYVAFAAVFMKFLSSC